MAVERRDEFSRIEIGEGYDRHFRESECIFDGLCDGFLLRFIDAAA